MHANSCFNMIFNNITIHNMKARIILIICLITGIAAHLSANEKIYINREVTTHIVMPENIKWWIFPLLKL